MKLAMPIFFILFLSFQAKNTQEWRKFAPLNTTRANVEEVLGPAGEGFEVLYDLKNGKLSIEYSTGPCSVERKGGWNVAKDVVISLHFAPRQPKKLADLQLDLRKFRKVVNEHLPSVAYYINDEDGITYAIQQGKLDYIEYGPTKKQQSLYCKDQL